MLTISNFAQHAARLVDRNIDESERRKLAAEVREAIEVVHSQDYGAFLEHFLKAFVDVLTVVTKPQYTNNDIHKTRSIILEVMSRLPHNDVLKSRCHQLLPLAMNVMQTDNEENSVTAIHIVFDLHKTFRPDLETQVEPFLSFVRQLYSSLRNTVSTVLLNPSAPTSTIPKASESFKVITECPLVVMFVFQLYPRCIRPNIQALLPLMLKAIQIDVPADQRHVFAKPSYKDFIAAQVKTVTFLVYLLKQLPTLMNFDETWIPQSVVQLLKACPGNAISIRKELLVATRHMLGSPFRKGFFSRIDALLDERVIAGTGRASTEALRPLGYQFLAELIHGVRFDLSLPQLSRIITMFSTNLHDPTFSFALQTNAVRLLLNLVEGILRRNDSKSSTPRDLLVRIMRTMVAKYVSISNHVPRLLALMEETDNGETVAVSPSFPLSAKSIGDPLKEVNDCKLLLKTLTLGLKTVVWSVINIRVALVAPPTVPRFIDRSKPQPTNNPVGKTPESENAKSMVLLEEEKEVLTQLLPISQKCFMLYGQVDQRNPTQAQKEIYDQFAQIFTILDVRSFQDIFGLRMEALLGYIVESPSALVVAQHFLSNQHVAKYFADILLNFVVEKLPKLSGPRPKNKSELTKEQKQANALLSLFKSLFGSIQNALEHVLRLHVSTIVRKSISLAVKSEDPFIYLQLLRCLFKSLTGGKKLDLHFDTLFRDFMPLVEPVLSGLVTLYNGPHRIAHKDMIIELCLLIPARPATLFPYLRVQMKPILWALRGCKENVQYGLRALDFWLDMLQPNYFETLLNIVEPDLTIALHSHLRLHYGNSFGTAALRTIGKLGGRSRRVPLTNEPLGRCSNNDDIVQYRFQWCNIDNPQFDLNSADLLKRACTIVTNESRDGKACFTPNQRKMAWEFCRVCLTPFLGLHNEDNIVFASSTSDEDKVRIFKELFESKSEGRNLTLQLPVTEEARREAGMPPRTQDRCRAEEQLIRRLLVAVIAAASFPDFTVQDEETERKSSPMKFADGMSKYFGLLTGMACEQPDTITSNLQSNFSADFSSRTLLDPRIFADALVSVLSRERSDHRKAATECLESYLRFALYACGVKLEETQEKSSVNTIVPSNWRPPTTLTYLINCLRHQCYKNGWNYKLGGLVGLEVVFSVIPVELLESKSSEIELVRALMFIVEESPNKLCFMLIDQAKSCMLSLISLCHKKSKEVPAKSDDARLNELVSCLVSKLCSSSSVARSLAQDTLRHLGAILEQSLASIMVPVKDKVIAPLRKRLIRQLSLPAQIGYLDAVTFCLQLDEPLISEDLFSPLMESNFLSGVLAIPDDSMFERLTEAEDGFRHKLVENKLIHNDVVVHLSQLRYHAVDLLTSLTIRCIKSLQQPSNDDMFRRIIMIFFKCLQSRDKKLVETARKGLKQAITHHPKPKETLQRSLRPILANLSDYKKLTLPYLEGLSRILELLSHWFTVNLGDKLLEHLQHWTEPQKIVNLKRGPPGTESRIGAAILELFHLLPSAASKFMDSLVYMVLRLEFELGVAGPGIARLGLKGRSMASTSPFREPLLKFCNRHTSNAVTFFLSHLPEPQIGHLFFVLLRAGDGGPLRAKLRSESDLFLNSTFNLGAGKPDVVPLTFAGVQIIDAILHDAPSRWLDDNPKVLTALLGNWNLRAMKPAEPGREMKPDDVDELLCMSRILIRYCEHNLKATTVLYELLKVFVLRMECDFTFIKDFLSTTVTSRFDNETKKAVLSYFLNAFLDKNRSQEWKVNALQYIVVPMTKEHLKEACSAQTQSTTDTSESVIPPDYRDPVLDCETLKRMVKELFDRPDEILRSYDETLSAELLQLSTILIQFIPHQAGLYRKELIKFGWAHLKREESVAKHWAFVNVSRFFHAYQAPPKIILQVYVALLRAVQGESKGLVRTALDILTPALPRRLEHNPSDKKCPIWIRYTKKVLLEEGHSVVNLVHIWQLVIRHADLFYVARAQFVPIMVTSLSRIGIQNNISTEYRRVALDLAQLIISWKTQNSDESDVSEPPAKKQRLANQDLPSDRPDEIGDFRPNTAMLHVTVNFLTQLPFRPMEIRERELIAKCCVALVDKAIQGCPTLTFKLVSFERLWESSEKSLNQVTRAKPSTPSATTSNDAKPSAQQSRSASVRNERLEAHRIDRLAHRKAVLHAALELCVVFTRRQCAVFIENNLTMLISIIPIVLTGRDPVAAKLLASILVNVLRGFPTLNEERSAQPGPVARNGKNESSGERFFSTVLNSLEGSLRADDITVDYCGLIVLKELCEERPTEFTRYRESVIKLFSKLVKETVQQPAQQNSPKPKTVQTPSTANRGTENESSGPNNNRSGSGASGALTSEVPKVAVEGLAKTLCLTVLGANITSLEANNRKAFIHGLCYLIERCVTVEVLLEIVRIVGTWVTWRQKQSPTQEKAVPRVKGAVQKEPLVLKEKVQLLLKMIVFERISGPGAQKLMNSYLDVILTIFGSKGCTDRRPDLLPKLERAFLIGLNSRDASMRARFFHLFEGSLTRNPLGRLHYILSRQDWSHLVEAYWIKHAVSLIVSSVDTKSSLVLVPSSARFPRVSIIDSMNIVADTPSNGSTFDLSNIKSDYSNLSEFVVSSLKVTSGTFCQTLQDLIFHDDELSYLAWVSLFPRIWEMCSNAERSSLETSLYALLLKEYHIMQSSWQRNAIQALLDGAYKAHPQPPIPAELLLHLGSRWNAWYTVVSWLQSRYEICCNDSVNSRVPKTDNEKDAVVHVLSRIFDKLNERDHFSGLLKQTSNAVVRDALALEQRGMEHESQELYSQLMQQYQSTYYKSNTVVNNLSLSVTEIQSLSQRDVNFIESRWIHCAKQLCQWDTLTEFARSVVASDLLHECLWRAPDWSAMKELLYRHPVEDGPTLRLYQAYIHLQENKLESADSSITMGFKKALERYCSLPHGSGIDGISDVLCQFQQLVELEESSKILAELNALSRAGEPNVNVEQKIETVKNILAAWRERLPFSYEPLRVWNNILSWRNHVHAIVVNVLETLKDQATKNVAAAQAQAETTAANGRPTASPSANTTAGSIQAAFAISQSLPQHVLVIGVNETAWNIHRFARACRKQGHPNVAINALMKLYPFGTMELSEYFVKTMESAKSYFNGPSGLPNNLEYGLNELNRCNMDHFNARQKSQLFTMKGKFYEKLGMNDQAADCFSIALSISGDVASGWLAWAHYCDNLQKQSPTNETRIVWRESAVNCYLQAIRFGSRKSRNMVPRVLRLLSLDINNINTVASDAVKRNVPGRVASVVLNFVDCIPAWVWVPWSSQIISMLTKTEAVVAQRILARVSHSYPQAVVLMLRHFLDLRRDSDNPSKSLARDAMKSNATNSSGLLPGFAGSDNVVGQIQALTESSKSLQIQFQHAHSKKKRLEVEMSKSGPGSANFDSLRAEYTKTRDEVNNFMKHLGRVTESLRTLKMKQLRQAYSSNSGNDASALRKSASGLEVGKLPGESQNQSRPAGNERNRTGEGGSGSERQSAEENDYRVPITPFDQADSILARIVKSHQRMYGDIDRIVRELTKELEPQIIEQLVSFLNSLLLVCGLESSPSQFWWDPSIRTTISDVFARWLKIFAKLTGRSSGNELADSRDLFLSYLGTDSFPDPEKDIQGFIRGLKSWRKKLIRRLQRSSLELNMERISRFLVDVVDTDVEIFGQYVIAEATELRTDSHTKITRFGADVEAIRSQFGFSRGLEVIGSDGTSHRFSVETLIDASTHQMEESMNLFYRLIDSSFFTHYPQAALRRIHISIPKLIPISRNSRLRTYDPNQCTLKCALDLFVEKSKQVNDDDIVLMNRKEWDNSLKAKRMEIYSKMCERVPENSLARVVSNRIISTSRLFVFKKKFAETIRTSSIVNNVHGVCSRRAENMGFSWETGVVTDCNFKVETNSVGSSGNGYRAPFRLTRNLRNLMGSIGLSGPFTASLGVSMDALESNPKLLGVYYESILSTLYGTLMVKRSVKDAPSFAGPLENADDSTPEFTSRVEVIVERAMKRLKSVSRGAPTKNADGHKLTRGVEELIESCTKEENLAGMDPLWAAWY